MIFFDKKEEPIKKPESDGEKAEEENQKNPVDDITIKVMPEEYRYYRQTIKKSNKFGLWLVIIGGALILFGLAALTYFVYYKSDLNKNNVITPPKKEQPIVQEQPKELPKEASPKEEYLKMNSEFALIANWSELESFINKYGSPSGVAGYNQVKEKAVNLSDEQKQQVIIAYIKSVPKLNSNDSIKEVVNGNQATLEIDLASGIKGSVVLSKLNGQWKLEKENWLNNGNNTKLDNLITQFSTVATSTETATTTEINEKQETKEYTNGKDTDQDGLTDKEEVVLGTDPNKSDTDGDKYSDMNELMNLYYPLGNGKLFATDLFVRYADNKDYIAYYPKGWEVSSPTGSDSTVFKSIDGHFLQISVQPNQDKRSIEDWYKEQFNSTSVNISDYTGGDEWQGIKSSDGRNIYLTDLTRKNIYILTYNPGVNETIEYLHFFEILVKSFSLK